jgi:hypothetical protein
MSPDPVNGPVSRPSRRAYVPGVYNYCDRWCERCRFNTRCAVKAMSDDMNAAEARGEDPAGVDPPDETPDPPGGGVARPWLEEILNYQPTEAETREIEAREAERDRLLALDPVALAAREYGSIAYRVARALQGNLTGGDPIVLAALDAIERHALCISAKTWRAVSGQLRLQSDDDDDEFDFGLQSDSSGSAKITRLMVQESREAWMVLMQVGRAAADGVPMKMIERLDKLDGDLARRFPRAMEFIRPGFDDGA